jgi:hypothetical protein
MKQPRTRARSLVLAMFAAVSVLGLSAVQASAQDNVPVDPGVRCAAKIGPGQYEFYLPGEKATDVNGNKWVCGPDGQWFRDYSAIIRNPVNISTSSIYKAAYP